jgi:hypothetical protein
VKIKEILTMDINGWRQSTEEEIAMHEEECLFTSSPILDENVPLEEKLTHEEPINLYEMANLSSNITGIPNIIIWVNGGANKLRHAQRIKVAKGNHFAPALTSTIPIVGMPWVQGHADLTQDDLAMIMQWVELNRPVLLAYGEDKMSTDEMISMLKKIS